MSKYDIPDLPSDDELGIDDEDLAEFLEDEESELSDEEMKALLGESRKPAPAPSPPRAKKEKRSSRKKPPADQEPRVDKESDAEEERPQAEGKQPSTAPDGPRSRWKGPVTMALLVFGAWFGSSSTAVPAAVPANAPDTAFSSARAMSHLVNVARMAHPPGSPEHERVRGYLLDELRDLGLEPEVQTATSMIRANRMLRSVTARNIVARIPGTDDTGAVLVTAHYDGRELSHAAADDGSGVVAILESLRALQAGEPLRNDLIVLLTDAEELGLLGARAFVGQHPWMADVGVVLGLEMRGAGGASVMFESGDASGGFLQAYKAAAPAPFANSISAAIYDLIPNDTDFTPFREAGKQGLNFAVVGRSHIYHQAYDNPANLQEGSLQHHGLNTLSMIRHLGSRDLSSVADPAVVYFTVPILGLVLYPKAWVWPLTGALALLWLVIAFAVTRRPRGFGGLVSGAVISLVSVGVVWGAGHWLNRWLPRFHPEAGMLDGSVFHSEGWYLLALCSLALTVVTTLLGLGRRMFTLPALSAGAGVVLVPLVVGFTYLMPDGAPNLQWPAIAFIAAVAAGSMGSKGVFGAMRWVVSAAAALVVLFVLSSILELVWLTLSIRTASLLGAAVVVALLMMMPALDALREPNSWWAPLTSLVLAGTFLGVGIARASPSPQRPLPSTLIYALDHDTGESWWATQPSRGAGDVSREWAETQASTTFDTTRSLEEFAPAGWSYDVAPAPWFDLPRPTVTISEDSVVDGLRHLRLFARSDLGAERVVFQFGEPGVSLTAINGRPPPTADRRGNPVDGPLQTVEHWGVPDTIIALDLTLEAADSVFAFTVIEQFYRPAELVGAEAFQRPPGLAPNVRTGSDRALIRTSISAPLTPVLRSELPPAEGLVTDSLAPGPALPDTGVTIIVEDTTPADTSSVADTLR
jgi:hypothetical protein